MSWKDRVKKARKEKGLTLEDVAKLVGVSTSTVFKIEQGELKNVNADFAEKMANVLGIPVDEFMEGVAEKTPKPKKASRVIPVYEHVGCGVPAFGSDDAVDYITFEGGNDSEEYFGLIAQGDSMEPMISSGDTLILRRQPSADAGDYAAVRIGDEEFLMKRVCMDTTGLTLKSLNSDYAPIFYSWDDVKALPVTVIGKLIEVRKQLQ